eukprot:CAMPEP_0168849612 /NCGR_PEP_ID=MMETSP0727-20121128/11454_1 /TAXON_ID=265536 /ORGANISM="Amphiprora sp., Strain CCMP467" /LENGTH=400 /DNA_ID=CAMNT_0008903515 /DNA_START=16 /DNA_END=1218 /DNA_ORIENTATION=-
MTTMIATSSTSSSRLLVQAFQGTTPFRRRPTMMTTKATTATLAARIRSSNRMNHHPSRWFSSTTRITLSSSSSSSYGDNMNQHDMMESDLLIAVNELDQAILPNNNNHHNKSDSRLTKRLGHTFGPATPRATLHRAFSLFLFDSSGRRMLLTQRAASKLTFPNVWTNACCSHPLQDMAVDEVDDGIRDYPTFPGIKQAAWRKCRHELGLDLRALMATTEDGDDSDDDPTQQRQLQLQDKMQFITRFHYWAADSVTYGPSTEWGEHEVDYVLFLQLPPGIETSGSLLQPNPEEVGDYKWVTIDELQAMLKSGNNKNLLWSPWFVGILERGGFEWWKDLSGALSGKYTNDQITFFDPPPEHVADYNLPSHNRWTGVWKWNPGKNEPGSASSKTKDETMSTSS